MAFFDKLMFWKKKDDFDFGSGLDSGGGSSGGSGGFGSSSSPYGNSNLGTNQSMTGNFGDV